MSNQIIDNLASGRYRLGTVAALCRPFRGLESSNIRLIPSVESLG